MDLRKTVLFSRPIAHRGLHDEVAPENSMASFAKAIEKGYPIELDVRPIDDGSIVVFHDDKITRMTNRDGYVCNLTKSDLAEIKLSDSNERIPLFAEVLDFVAGRVPLLIEIKNEAKVGALEHATLELLKDYKGEFAVQSFNPYSLEYFKKFAPQITRGQLSGFFEETDLARIKKFFLKRLLLNKVSSPNFISYEGKNLPNKFVTKANLPVLAWTAQSNADYENFKKFADNVIFENFIPEND